MDHELPIIQYQDRAGILDLSWGHPHPDTLPIEGWLAAGEETLRGFGWRALAYGYPAGPGPLLDWLAEHLPTVDPGLRVVPDGADTFVTAGASHALELVTSLLTRPGDLVLVDSPTYHLALRVIADHRVEIVGVPVDAAGIDPQATADLIVAAQRAGRRVPMLYVVPTFGNPTGRSLPADRRAALVEVAERTGVTIVEDDTYRELVYSGNSPASLRSLGESVVRLGSFAKTVAPGIRLGWVNAAPEVIRGLVGRGYVTSGGGVNHLAALTMATFGASGDYRRHVDEIRLRYAAQRDALVGALHATLPALQIPYPAGGWFSWLALPPGMRASALLPVAERLGVSFVEGTEFYPGSGGEEHIRLSFSLLDPAELAMAAQRLATAIGSLQGP